MEKITRNSGILLHVTSLPDNLGLGTFSASCERFIDFMVSAKFKTWQVLPLNDCGYAKSPYSAVSVFAFNPYLLDITRYLTQDEVFGLEINKFNPNAMEEANKFDIAHKLIFEKLKDKYDTAEFYKNNVCWLDDYAIYKTLKKKHKDVSWVDFDVKYKDKNKTAIAEFIKENKDEIEKHKFIQYLLHTRWQEIKKYANNRGVEIFGDMPMYVELDSADVWSNPKNWQLIDGKPKAVAGVPPDYFCKEGQRWGNPLYDYEYMKTKKYDFWVRRFKKASELYDVIRIDHFIAFARYWSIPAKSQTAIKGKWVNGAGEDILSLVSKLKIKVVAEDLGILGEDVISLRDKFKLPGLKVVQFAFDGIGDNVYQPHNFEKNCVAYIGTHDNDTFMGLLSEGDWDKINRFKKYLRMPLEEGNEKVVENTIISLYRSSANMIILTAQDILKLGKEARMNIPGSIEGNWLWQLKSDLNYDLCNFYSELATLYAR